MQMHVYKKDTKVKGKEKNQSQAFIFPATIYTRSILLAREC